MAVTRDWIPKQIDKFYIFANNLCKRATTNASKWHLDADELAALLGLQTTFNRYYEITSVRSTFSSLDTQNTKDARKFYQKSLRMMGIGRMKRNSFMTNVDRKACGLNINSNGYNLSPVAKKAPLIDYRNKGGLNGVVISIDPTTHKTCKPIGQDGVKVAFGFYRNGEPIPKERECTFTIFLTKSFGKMVFPEAQLGMCFVGYARYFNTRNVLGTVASGFYGMVG